MEAAGQNGTVGVDGVAATFLRNLTVSGTGYTVTGGDNAVPANGDQMTVTGASNVINVRQGDDAVNVSGSANTVSLGSGSDQVMVSGNSNVIHNNNDNGADPAGVDRIEVTGSFNTVRSDYNADTNVADQVVVAGASNVTDATTSGNNGLRYTDQGVENTLLGGWNGMHALATSEAIHPTMIMGMGEDSVTIAGAVGGHYSLGGGNDHMTVNGGTGHDINLGTGADEITLRGTYESIYAGTGDDTIVFDGQAAGTNTDGFNYVDLVEDNNLVSINGGDGHTTIIGGLSADSIFFTGGDVEQDVLRMGAGNDFVSLDGTARGNNTSIYGGVGDDSIYAATAEQLMVDGGTGDDSIIIEDARYNTIVSGAGDDSITLGTAGADTSTGYNVVNLGGLEGNTGHNVVSIGGGLTNNIVYGGAEKDIIDLGASAAATKSACGRRIPPSSPAAATTPSPAPKAARMSSTAPWSRRAKKSSSPITASPTRTSSPAPRRSPTRRAVCCRRPSWARPPSSRRTARSSPARPALSTPTSLRPRATTASRSMCATR